MKQIASIFLILLLSFYWHGYRLIINHFQQQADHELQARLDASDYSEADLIEIRVPLNLPYQNNFTEFERCYGEIVIDDIIHTYVKRKVENGVLVLKCIPNQEKQAIKNADTDFFAGNNGFGHQQKENTPLAKVFKSIFCDCENSSLSFDMNILSRSRQNNFNLTPHIDRAELAVAEQPPDQFC